MASTRSGHHDLDFPEVIGHAYAGNNPAIAPLPVIFLFKLASPARDEIIKQIFQGDGSTWPERVPKKAIGVIPWLRSFTLTIDDVVEIAAGTCILLDEDLFHDGKCLVCHNFFLPTHVLGDDPREYGIADLNQAYRLACAESSKTSFFPTLLHPSQKFIPDKKPETPKKHNNLPETLTGDLPVFITVPISPAQETYLLALLTCESSTPDFIHVPNASPAESDDMDHLMQYFDTHAWFPGDFALIDAATLSSIPTPIPVALDDPPYSEFDGPFPSFGIATELLMWYREEVGESGGSYGQLVGRDSVGYVFGRREVEDCEEFAGWCGNVGRGMGLGSWMGSAVGEIVGADGEDEEEEEELERYYWGCWLNERGRVDGEVRAEAVVKY